MEHEIPATEEIYRQFMSKIAHSGTGCWEWTGDRTSTNYGQMKVGGRKVPATYVALTLSGRPREGRLHALHSCDNPPCVNPKHLRWGTHKENMQDKVSRGRMNLAVGERHPLAKLTAEKVRYIRNSPLGYKALARELGVERTTIRGVRHGKIWKHVT